MVRVPNDPRRIRTLQRSRVETTRGWRNILCHADLSHQSKGEFKYKKEIANSYDVILMALKSTFEQVIDKAYHTTGNAGIMGDGFGQLTPFEILQKLRKTYGRANIQEIESKLLQLNNPMDRNLPVEVMICDIEDVQRFLLANPADEWNSPMCNCAPMD